MRSPRKYYQDTWVKFEAMGSREISYFAAEKAGKFLLGLGIALGTYNMLPHEAPSIGHNLAVERCADQLGFSGKTVAAKAVPKVCRDFQDTFDYDYIQNDYTLPEKTAFRADNTWTPEDDHDIQVAHEARDMIALTLGGATVGACAFRRRLIAVDIERGFAQLLEEESRN